METQVDYRKCGADIDISGHRVVQSRLVQIVDTCTGAQVQIVETCTGAKTADFAKKCWRARRVSRNVNIKSPSSSHNISVIISVLLAIN